MAAECVELNISERVAQLTLNRPDAGNALDQTTCRGLRKAFEAIAAAKASVGCILLSASGKNFCVGGDVAYMRGAPSLSDGIDDLVGPLHDALKVLDDLGLPLVVAVQGAAAGAGMSLVALADHAVAADNAKFVMAYSAIGLTPDGGATWSLARAIGHRRAMELAMTNRRLTAHEALSWGLVNEVCDPLELDRRAEQVARVIADGPTEALMITKALMRAGAQSSLLEQLDREYTAILSAAQGTDAQEGVQSLKEKRQPKFNET